MTYILHGAPGSGSGIVEAACVELGVAYEVRDLDARNDEHRGQAYAALNPQRKMPTIELGEGEVLTETVAILVTLDERHPGRLLPPIGSRARAQALRWMVFCATELYPIVEIMDYPQRFAGQGQSAEATKARAQEIWHARWLVVEGGIAGTPYCVDTGFTAADLYIMWLSRWDMTEAWRREHLPRIEALSAAVLARPALVPIRARHMPRG